MDINGKPAAPPAAAPIILTGGTIAIPGQIDRMTLCGTVDGKAMWTMDLTSFGAADPLPFLAAVFNALREQRSGLVIPRA